MPNPVTWFEILGEDPIKLQKFYGDVFGWKLRPPLPQMGNYSILDNEDQGIPGGIGGVMEGSPHRVTVYIEVDDPQGYLNRAEGAGATVVMPVTEITEGTTLALFTDPDGNVIGLLKA